MAREYGFRVYSIKMYANQIKNKEPLEVHLGSAHQEELISVIDEAARRGTRFIDTVQPDDEDEPRIPKLSITVDQPVDIGEGKLHLEVSTGEIGGHRWAKSEDGKEYPIANASAERGHFVTLIFPKPDIAANEFLMVVETHRSADVRSRLLWLLNLVSYDMKRAAKAKQDAERKRLKKQGEKLPKKKHFNKYLFEARQVADSAHFNHVLQTARSATAVFTEHIPSPTGGNGNSIRRRLSYSLITEEDRRAAGDVGRRWFSRVRGHGAQSTEPAPDAVMELAEAVNTEEGEVASYDSASLNIKSDTGFSVTVKPDDVRDMFTYEVSDGRPSERFFYHKIAPKVSDLALTLDLEIFPIETAEVEECLNDSNDSASDQSLTA